MLKVAVLGLGSRGKNYGEYLVKTPDVQVVALCDKIPAKIENVRKAWNVPAERCYLSDETFFGQGKIADILVIATQDKDHYGHAMRALDLGYHLLLEKPVSPDVEQCLDIEQKAREKGLKVLVCHVLRYATYYRYIHDLIAAGELGDVLLIKHDENIAHWHFAHSYVRGNWRKESESSPMMLAKCCHDLDLIYWFAASKCKSVVSQGGLMHFKADKAPQGAADNCFDCPHRATCPYDCEHLYVGRKKGLIRAKRKFRWNASFAFCLSHKTQDILHALRNEPRGKQYARCVYRCDNDVADTQTVQMEMCNGTQVVMTVNAFNEHDHRHTEIRGTKGELYADDMGSVIRIRHFDKRERKIVVNVIPVIKGHYGGDQGVIRALIDMLRDGKPSEHHSLIEQTVESHRIAAAIELSRREGGRRVEMSEIPDIRESK